MSAPELALNFPPDEGTLLLSDLPEYIVACLGVDLAEATEIAQRVIAEAIQKNCIVSVVPSGGNH